MKLFVRIACMSGNYILQSYILGGLTEVLRKMGESWVNISKL